MKIVDDFLTKKIFDELQTFLMGEQITWHCSKTIDYPGEKNKFQFCHDFYRNHAPCSMNFNIILPILTMIKPVSMWRIKANLLTITPNIVENNFHIDMGGI